MIKSETEVKDFFLSLKAKILKEIYYQESKDNYNHIERILYKDLYDYYSIQCEENKKSLAKCYRIIVEEDIIDLYNLIVEVINNYISIKDGYYNNISDEKILSLHEAIGNKLSILESNIPEYTR